MSARQLKRKNRFAIEGLESRRLLSVTTLSNGTGPAGSVTLGVDSYGAFGSLLTGQTTQYANFTVGLTGIVNRSYVYFSPLGKFLTSYDGSTAAPITGADPVPVTPIPGGAQPDVAFTSTSATTAVSVFTLSGTQAGTPFSYEITLTQTLSGIVPTDLIRYSPSAGNPKQTTLTQTYSIRNLLNATTNFTVDRYLQPQQNLDATQNKVGSQFDGSDLFADRGQTLIASGETNGTEDNFLQLRSFGGTFSAAGIQNSGVDSTIFANGDLPATSQGAINDQGGGLTTGLLAYAQERAFTVGPTETVEYTVVTTFGQQTPIQLQAAEGSAPPDAITAPPGDFAFSSTSYNFDFAKDGTGTPGPVQISVSRLGGTAGAASVTVTVLGAPAGAVTITPSTLNFADGDSNDQTFFLTVDPTKVDIQPSSFLLQLSTTTDGSATIAPSIATVNVLPQSPVISFHDLTDPNATDPRLTATAAQFGGSLTVTLFRSGDLAGSAAVNVVTANGTGTNAATAGVDFGVSGSSAQYSTTVLFADRQSTATFTIPILSGQQDGVQRAFSINLSGAVPADGTGNLSLVPTASIPVKFNSVDAGAPLITHLSTVVTANAKQIQSISLLFSESLLGPGDLSTYFVYARSGEGAGGSAKLKPVALRSVAILPGTNVVSVVPAKPLAFNTNYEIVVKPSASLTDVSGNVFNQNPTAGMPNYISYFARGTKVNYVDASGDNVTLTMKGGGNFEVDRATSGESATVTLFGLGAKSIFSGSIKKTKAGPGATDLGLLSNAASGTVSLPSNITYTLTGTPT